MLTNRQIHILSYLANHEGWVSGEQLSDHFHLDRKTVQSELRLLEQELGSQGQIESSRKGYRLTTLTPAARKSIYQEITACGGRNCLGARPSALILYLMLLKDYISMQQLAELFYLSKTAVSLEMETLKRWAARYEGLSLEVSTSRGIRLDGPEDRKRSYCARFATVQAMRSVPVDQETVQAYESILQTVTDVLKQAFTAAGFWITGEAFDESCRYLAVCSLRSQMGFQLETPALRPAGPYAGFSAQACGQIAQICGYRFTEAEIACFAFRLEGENTLNNWAAAPFPYEAQEGLEKLESRLQHILPTTPQPLLLRREAFLPSITKLMVRRQAGSVAINHYNEEIICRYPLETHLICTLLPDCFGLEPNKETSFLALQLASQLNQGRDTISVLLVSNQNQSVIGQIASALQGIGSPQMVRFQVLPGYAFACDPTVCADFDVLLTTDQATLMLSPQFHLIPCILTYDDVQQLDLYLKKKAESLREERQIDFLETCYQIQHVPGSSDLSALLPPASAGCQESRQTLGSKRLYVCRTGPCETGRLWVYDLELPILFRHKKIRRVIFASFQEGQPGMLQFFTTVSEFLTKELEG